MKKIALISTFCDTKEKQDILYENVLILKRIGIDVMGIGPKTIQLPNNIINEFDYFFYTKDNPLLSWPLRDFSFWKTVWTSKGFIKLQHCVNDYGWAALYHVKKLSQIALTFNYDIYYHLIYDVEIDEGLLNDIKSDVVNKINPRRDPNNYEHLWDASLHFMVFNREMMELIEKEITLENYLSTSGAAEGEVLKWKNKFNIPTSGYPVKDKIFYWGEKDFFNYSNSNEYKFFISKNFDYNPQNLRIFVYDFNQEKNVKVIINDNEYNETLTESKFMEFNETHGEILTLKMKIDNDEYDLTKIYFDISRNLIYYDN